MEAIIRSLYAKMLRLELLKVKADLERQTWVPNCTKCGLEVHWVSGLGVTPGHWGHREGAPHGEPTLWNPKCGGPLEWPLPPGFPHASRR